MLSAQYWSHRVTAIDLSISVNVFSETRELVDFYAMQKTPLDFFTAKKGDLAAVRALAAPFAATYAH